MQILVFIIGRCYDVNIHQQGIYLTSGYSVLHSTGGGRKWHVCRVKSLLCRQYHADTFIKIHLFCCRLSMTAGNIILVLFLWWRQMFIYQKINTIMRNTIRVKMPRDLFSILSMSWVWVRWIFVTNGLQKLTLCPLIGVKWKPRQLLTTLRWFV
jgi:hypothetical protein